MKIDYFCLFSAFIGINFGIPIVSKNQEKTLSCDHGWSWAPIQQQCIRVQDTYMTQLGAEADCQEYDGHLVSITTAFQETEIINITRQVGRCSFYWIGAKKSGNGPYTWTDGKPYGYSHFGPSPDNNSAYDCVDFRPASANWHTWDCNQKNCFVCAKPDGQGNQNPGGTVTGTDCADLKAAGNTKSGIYTLTLNGQNFQVYCDMDTENGGWSVIQQRIDGSLSFWDESWQSYKQGFGNPDAETNFWAGNEFIHLLTTKDEHVVLRVDLWGDRDPGSIHAKDYWWGEYYMKVGDESTDYTLNVQIKYLHPDKPNNWTTVGNASTAWYDITCSDGIKFSTVDRINDPLTKCVTDYHLSGWWLRYCGTTSLNGEYIPPISYGNGYGFVWMVDGFYPINPVKSRMSLRVEKTGTKIKTRNKIL